MRTQQLQMTLHLWEICFQPYTVESVARHNLYGVNINEDAVEIADYLCETAKGEALIWMISYLC